MMCRFWPWHILLFVPFADSVLPLFISHCLACISILHPMIYLLCLTPDKTCNDNQLNYYKWGQQNSYSNWFYFLLTGPFVFIIAGTASEYPQMWNVISVCHTCAPGIHLLLELKGLNGIQSFLTPWAWTLCSIRAWKFQVKSSLV